MACDFQSHSQFPRIARISCKFFERKSLEIFSIKWNRAADLCAPPPNCGSWVSVLLNSSLHVHIGEQMEGESKNIRCWVGFFPSILLWAHYLLEADCRGWTICIVKTCHSLHGCCGSASYHHHRHHRLHHDDDHHDIIIVVFKIITTWGCTSLSVADAISSWLHYVKIKTSVLFRGIELETRLSQKWLLGLLYQNQHLFFNEVL